MPSSIQQILVASSPAASYPQVVQRASAGATTRGTSTSPTFSAAAAGELLVVAIAMENNGAGPSTPAGWTAAFVPVTNTVILGVYTKVAAGGETGVTISHGNNETVWMAWRINGTSAGVYTVATATGTSTGPDAPSVTPAAGSKDYLWLAGAAQRVSAATGYPATYTQGQQTIASTGANVSVIESAERQLTSTTDDPGAFTIAASQAWVAFTMAVSP
jgi:hypothetical protein